MNFKSDLIYPEVKIKDENIDDAKKLLNIYTGRNSIINNIFTYLYQASFLEEEYSSILKELIEVELFHAKIISKVINLLGFKPRYIYKSINGYKYYNTSYINYETNINKIIIDNLILKEKLIDKYNELINNIEDENVKEILKRIIIDENIHLRIFKDLNNKVINN